MKCQHLHLRKASRNSHCLIWNHFIGMRFVFGKERTTCGYFLPLVLYDQESRIIGLLKTRDHQVQDEIKTKGYRYRRPKRMRQVELLHESQQDRS